MFRQPFYISINIFRSPISFLLKSDALDSQNIGATGGIEAHRDHFLGKRLH